MSTNLIMEIKERKTKKRIKNSDIARELNVTPGTITQYFGEDQQIRIGLIHFIKLINMVYDDSKDMRKSSLEEFCRTTKRPANLRLAMEYTHMIGESNLLEVILNQELNKKRPNDEWASVYRILLKRNRGLRGAKLLQAIEELMNKRKLKTAEMKILIKIIRMYAYFEMNEHGSMFKLTKELSVEINTIKNSYIKESFRVRMLEAYALGYLHGNEVDAARDTATELVSEKYIEQFGSYVANGYHVLAQSYLFEDFEKVDSYLNRGLEILENIDSSRASALKKQLESTHVFSKLHWSQSVEEDALENKGELLHYMTKMGKHDEANRILNELKEENGKLSAFQIYYKGLLENDGQLFRKSLELFKKQGNEFYLMLPLVQLQKLSEENNENLEMIW